MIKFNTNNVISTSPNLIVKKYKTTIRKIYEQFQNKKLSGSEMSGWIDIIDNFNVNEMIKIKKIAKDWNKDKISDVVVIGIGGSYTGVRAGIEMCTDIYKEGVIKFTWIHNVSSTFICSQLKKFKNKKFAIIVISKSGKTLEPAIAFNLFRKLLVNNIGEKLSKKYIVAITDSNIGELHDIVSKNNYVSLDVPNNIGGRFSTLTNVGLLPLAISGIDPIKIYKGAKQALDDNKSGDISKSKAFLYAAYRHFFHIYKHKSIENFIIYEPSLEYMAILWRQLFGESEGKENKGLFPTYSIFTTDLHSMGQYLQEGRKIFFETTLIAQKPKFDIKLLIKDDKNLEFLNQKNLSDIHKYACQATIKAHSQIAKNDNLLISINQCDAYNFGYLVMWLQLAVMMSSYLLKINPFNQPGVEEYKKGMMSLLKTK